MSDWTLSRHEIQPVLIREDIEITYHGKFVRAHIDFVVSIIVSVHTKTRDITIRHSMGSLESPSVTDVEEAIEWVISKFDELYNKEGRNG
jgi:hypothetical protein